MYWDVAPCTLVVYHRFPEPIDLEVTLRTFIRHIFCWNLAQNTARPECVFHVFLSPSKPNSWILPRLGHDHFFVLGAGIAQSV